jgi:hypothetical protein
VKKEYCYYDLDFNWGRLKSCIDSDLVQSYLHKDFSKYVKGRFGRRYETTKMPFDYESCDWWLDMPWGEDARRKMPPYVSYVKHGACHWLVNFNWALISKAEPDHKWRIVSSNFHSSVWDGKYTFFDINFYAMEVPIEECVKLTIGQPDYRVLRQGSRLKCYVPEIIW